MPSTILSANSDSQQFSLAIPLVLQQDLATSKQYVAAYAPDSSAAYGSEAESVLRTVLEEDGSHLRLQATLTNLRSQQNERVLVAESSRNGGLILLLDRLAKEIDPDRASPFSTRNDLALIDFTAAVAAPSSGNRQQLLQSATQRDPAFGLAQIAAVENASPQNVLPVQAPPVDKFVSLDRVRWEVLAARLQHASLSNQTTKEQAVLQVAPNNVEALARLGSELFLQGKGAEGERLLQQAATLAPANGNIRLQLAVGLVATRQFEKAEAVLTPLANENANLLPSLASVYLLAGKLNEANTLVRRFISFLPPAGQNAAQARWATLTGSGVSAEQPTADMPAGLALFAQGRYAEAASYWRAVVDESGDTNLPGRAMLAASLEQTGQTAAAHQIQVLPFVPDFNDPVATVAFSQMRRLLQMK